MTIQITEYKTHAGLVTIRLMDRPGLPAAYWHVFYGSRPESDYRSLADFECDGRPEPWVRACTAAQEWEDCEIEARQRETQAAACRARAKTALQDAPWTPPTPPKTETVKVKL